MGTERKTEAVETKPLSTKGHRSRARLLAAGKTVFERDGFLNARISDIAAEAGMSHGSFYHYFESKEAIFREVAEEVEERLLTIAQEEKNAPSDAVGRIRAANRSYLLAYKREAKIMRVIEEVSRYDDEVRAVRIKRDDHLAARMEAVIANMQQQGQADQRIDGRYAAMALGGMVARFAEQMFIAGGKYNLNESVEQLTLLWANSLGIKN